jgi:hypothetical protein
MPMVKVKDLNRYFEINSESEPYHDTEYTKKKQPLYTDK